MNGYAIVEGPTASLGARVDVAQAPTESFVGRPSMQARSIAAMTQHIQCVESLHDPAQDGQIASPIAALMDRRKRSEEGVLDGVFHAPRFVGAGSICSKALRFPACAGVWCRRELGGPNATAQQRLVRPSS